MEETGTVVVLDIGSDTCKVGLAGEAAPKVFPTLVVGNKDKGNVFIGDEAARKRDEEGVRVRRPVQRGEVTHHEDSWADLGHVIQHALYDVAKVAPEEHHVLMAVAPLTPLSHLQKLTQMMFEDFCVAGLCLCQSSALSLRASGRSTGLVLDCGHGASHAVPVHEGQVITNAIMRLDIGGDDLTDYMVRLLSERGRLSLNSMADKMAVNGAKERLCHVVMDIYKEEKALVAGSATEKEDVFSLPDGREVTVGAERFRMPEALFDPARLGFSALSLDHSAHTAIQSVEGPQLKEKLYRNIVLSGGSSLFPGLKEKLEQQLSIWTRGKMEVSVVAPPDRKLSVWHGGSLMAQGAGFLQHAVSRDEYNELGLSCVGRKFLP